MCSQEGLLDFENEEYVVFLSLIWAGPSSSLAPAILEYLSTVGKTRAAQPGAHLSPASILCFCSGICSL